MGPATPSRPDTPGVSRLDELNELGEALAEERRSRRATQDGPDGPEIDLGPLIDLRPKFTADPKGTVVMFRIPDRLARLVDILVAQEGIPYATRQDFARDALYLYAEALRQALNLQHPVVQHTLAQERLRSDAAFTAQEQVRYGEVLESVHNTLVSLLNQGAFTEIQRQLTDYWQLANDLSLRHWRETYLRGMADLAVVQACLLALDKLALRTPWHSAGYGQDGGDGDAEDEEAVS